MMANCRIIIGFLVKWEVTHKELQFLQPGPIFFDGQTITFSSLYHNILSLLFFTQIPAVLQILAQTQAVLTQILIINPIKMIMYEGVTTHANPTDKGRIPG